MLEMGSKGVRIIMSVEILESYFQRLSERLDKYYELQSNIDTTVTANSTKQKIRIAN